MEKIIKELKNHFSKNWEIEKIKENILKLTFKRDDGIHVIFAPELKILRYNLKGDKHSYQYISNDKEAQEFIELLKCFYPAPVKGKSNEFDIWADKWIHDFYKRNKKARELYGFEKR